MNREIFCVPSNRTNISHSSNTTFFCPHCGATSVCWVCYTSEYWDNRTLLSMHCSLGRLTQQFLAIRNSFTIIFQNAISDASCFFVPFSASSACIVCCPNTLLIAKRSRNTKANSRFLRSLVAGMDAVTGILFLMPRIATSSAGVVSPTLR